MFVVQVIGLFPAIASLNDVKINGQLLLLDKGPSEEDWIISEYIGECRSSFVAQMRSLGATPQLAYWNFPG